MPGITAKGAVLSREQPVEQGQKVNKGEIIGLVGASGRVTGPHLHWSMNLFGHLIDPLEMTRISKNWPPFFP